jgi:hypothetical protein
MRIPGILNSSGFLLFTLLIAFTALYIYFAINSSLRSIGVNSPSTTASQSLILNAMDFS